MQPNLKRIRNQSNKHFKGGPVKRFKMENDRFFTDVKNIRSAIKKNLDSIIGIENGLKFKLDMVQAAKAVA